MKVLVLERDAASARAVATLALEAIPGAADTILAQATSIDGAKRILERLTREQAGPLIVICAADLDEEGRALEIVEFARRQHAGTRAVVLTDGESERLRRVIAQGVDGLHQRDAGLEGLRTILAYLGQQSAHARADAPAAGSAAERLHVAQRALGEALEALEDAHDALTRDASRDGAAPTRVREAERHAIEAHRAALEAERLLREALGARSGAR